MEERTLSKVWRNLIWASMALAIAGLLAASMGSGMGEAGRSLLFGGTVVLFVGIVGVLLFARKLRCPFCGRPVDREIVRRLHNTPITCPQCGTKLVLK